MHPSQCIQNSGLTRMKFKIRTLAIFTGYLAKHLFATFPVNYFNLCNIRNISLAKANRFGPAQFISSEGSPGISRYAALIYKDRQNINVINQWDTAYYESYAKLNILWA